MKKRHRGIVEKAQKTIRYTNIIIICISLCTCAITVPHEHAVDVSRNAEKHPHHK